MATFGFIGCGNMGAALARAAAKVLPAGDIVLANRTREKAEVLAAELGCAVASNEQVAATCDYVVLGVKPQMMAEVLGGLRGLLDAARERTGRPAVVVSMAASTSIAAIRAMMGERDGGELGVGGESGAGDQGAVEGSGRGASRGASRGAGQGADGGAGEVCPVIRIMPNLPVAVGAGVVLVCSEGASLDERAEFSRVFAQSGALVDVDEAHIDAASALSGCGPAYLALMVEGLADGGVACGLRRDVAQELAVRTMLGSAAYLAETGMGPARLKDAVCSPGGTTIAGVLALEQGAFRADAAAAVRAAYGKTIEMQRED